MKYTIFVNADKMLSVFAGDRLFLPYQGQPDVQLVLALEEYRKFCDEMLKYDVPVFTLNKELYEKALKADNDILLKRLFYFELSKSLTNELKQSVVRGRNATSYVVGNESGEVIELPDTFPREDMLKGIDQVQKRLGFDSSILSDHNRAIYLRAIQLQVLSSKSG